MADCDNFYSPETGEFEDGNTLSISEYFDPTVMELSKTNIAFRSYPGLATYKYITDNITWDDGGMDIDIVMLATGNHLHFEN